MVFHFFTKDIKPLNRLKQNILGQTKGWIFSQNALIPDGIQLRLKDKEEKSSATGWNRIKLFSAALHCTAVANIDFTLVIVIWVEEYFIKH